MKQYLTKLINKQNLTRAEAEEVAERLATNQFTPAQAGALLCALAMKGETIEEIVGFVNVMRRHMTAINLPFDTLDTCGTGGDGANTFNVSTAAAMVTAAAGLKVAKHGNRSVSSSCGSMDVLEALGVKISLSPEQIEKCIKEVGIGFMFAPLFHPAMKFIAPIRKELGVRTIFNFIGPLLNPARADYQIIGVSSLEMANQLGAALMELGSKKVILVHSRDGLDEISPAALTDALIFRAGQEPEPLVIEPEIFYSLDEVKGKDAPTNAAIISAVLNGHGTPAQVEFVALNVAGALLAADVDESFDAAKTRAKQILKSGAAFTLLNQVREFTNSI